MTEKSTNFIIAQEVVKDVYNDGGKATVKATGDLVGLVPRAIKAALAPLEKWILNREYNIAQTQKLLEQKLQDVSPEMIEPPEAHIAVPAMQYISYCMDNSTLRDMYANLLASSMNKVVKKGVHPSFVEIIKQLCPDEAKMLCYLSSHPIIPTISVRCENEKGEGKDIIKNFSNVDELVHCEKCNETSAYFDNLGRLGLTRTSPTYFSLINKELYAPLKNHPHIKSMIDSISLQPDEFNKANIVEGFIEMTAYGKAFCKVCISPEKEVSSSTSE